MTRDREGTTEGGGRVGLGVGLGVGMSRRGGGGNEAEVTGVMEYK